MKHWLNIVSFLSGAIIIKFFLADVILNGDFSSWLKIITIFAIFYFGIRIVFNKTTVIIVKTTDALKKRTHLAGGYLQSFGTAFPDMVLGIVAAFTSLAQRDNDYGRAINLAIIAASTTFGSNIYNVFHASWCVWRQNVATKLDKSVAMFPFFKSAGRIMPLNEHPNKPKKIEIDKAVLVIMALTVITTFTALCMVLFGKVKFNPAGMSGDLYQLKQSIGIILFIFCVIILYINRKNIVKEKAELNNKYHDLRSHRLWFDLILAGISITFAASGMIKAMEVFSDITNLPIVITGIAAGIIGCLGEIIVIHNYTINPQGRIGDAIFGVAMDNIVTILGASIVALIGGVFLGGNSLIIIFIIILTGNTLLLYQLYNFRNSLTN
jgi:hypothetical protein